LFLNFALEREFELTLLKFALEFCLGCELTERKIELECFLENPSFLLRVLNLFAYPEDFLALVFGIGK
jgi:hypothetical protein